MHIYFSKLYTLSRDYSPKYREGKEELKLVLRHYLLQNSGQITSDMLNYNSYYSQPPRPGVMKVVHSPIHLEVT